MTSTESSDSMLVASNVQVYFELDHYIRKDLRDVFISAVSNPVDFLFKQKELFYVLNGVSFELKKGDRLGLIGVNGTGKTTLCRCIAGMMRPHGGKIQTKSEVRAIFDVGSGIMPELTGRENAYLLARLFYPKLKDLKAVVEESIEFSELGHFIDTPFKQYSKGMQSRLILSLISSLPADILILDEVFDGADVFFQAKLSQRMINFISNAGAAIFVSHSVDQIRQVCNKVLVLDHGKVSFLGDVEAGIDHYLSSRDNIKTPL